MRVFVAGAGGAIGQRLVPLLIQAGHLVGALTRSERKREQLSNLGATVFVADALNSESLSDAVRIFEPDAIVNQLTAIPARLNLRTFDRDFEQTNRLRIEGTDNLIAAGAKFGVVRFVAQSFTGWPNARDGGWVKSELDPLDPDPPAKLRSSLDAIKHVEDSVARKCQAEGVVLRYGPFYGPGTSLAKGGWVVEDIRKRKVPIIGEGRGVWSFIHIDDAASATIAALHAPPGVYNVTDNDPAPVRDWLPYLARTLGAKSPYHVPVWLARIVVGEHGVIMMTEMRGSSNEKAKRELNWRPQYASWREGFRTGLG